MLYQSQTDVVIIGAGPIGLFAVFQCGMMKLKCHVIDSLPTLGGQCNALYPTKTIYDIPGFYKISGKTLIDNLSHQAESFCPVYHLNQQVINLSFDKKNKLWGVYTSTGNTVLAKVIIIAAGMGALTPKRPLIENIDK